MSLSSNAIRYLRALRRYDMPSRVETARAIASEKCPAFDAWLSFQERFGGYEEVIAHDKAIWGIVHHTASFLTPERAAVERGEHGAWRVACADVHPAYDYWLDEEGIFCGCGEFAERFEIKVERNALFWSVSVAQHRPWSVDFDNSLGLMVGGVHELRKRLDAQKVDDASDKFAAYWSTPDLIIVDRAAGAIVYVARDARERLMHQLG